LKLGYLVAERTVSRYLARIRPEPITPRSQTWATFLKNHARELVAVDMFVLPTIRFQVLYIFIIPRPGTPTPHLRQRDHEPHGTVARPAGRQRLPLGHRTEIPHP